MSIDVLIVGQGLAGSLLALELLRRHFRIMVVDDGAENASKVAAGLINPITGRRLLKSEDVDKLLPAAMACYQELSDRFNQRFFVALPMLRVLKNAKEQALAQCRLVEIGYQAFLHGYQMNVHGVNSPCGLLQQSQTGYLKIEPLLAAVRDYLIANSSYRNTRLDYAEIVLKPRLAWRDLQPKHLVFCEGHHAIANPWFGSLPFQPVKGQILSCHTRAVFPRQILNFGHWLIPLTQTHFKLGATFEPGIIDTKPTVDAQQLLLQSLHQVCSGLQPIEITEHRAGVRPATLDKQPFIGTHPCYGNLHIFNGFGTKGSLAIPWYARRFVDALTEQLPLPSRCDIRRYAQTHFPV